MPRLSETRQKLLTTLMKDAIHEAVIGVLAEHGVDGLTMDRVAASANVAKGSLYNYFNSKQELLQFVFTKTFTPIHEAVDEIVVSDAPVAKKLETIIRTIFSYLATHRGVLNVLLKNETTWALLRPTDRSMRAEGIEQFATVFRQGIEQGVFRPLDPDLLGQMFLGAMTEVWERSLAANPSERMDAAVETVLALFLQGVVTGGSTSS